MPIELAPEFPLLTAVYSQLYRIRRSVDTLDLALEWEACGPLAGLARGRSPAGECPLEIFVTTLSQERCVARSGGEIAVFELKPDGTVAAQSP